MKIVIIGSGIAGLTCGIMLQRKGHDVVICERNTSGITGGHAFLMHSDGLQILESLIDNRDDMAIPGIPTASFIHKNLAGEEMKYMKLDGWQCMKRADLVSFLSQLIDDSFVKMGRSFSHFIVEEGVTKAVVFENGEVEYGDMFIAADGGNSKIRETLFGKTVFTPVEVQEILGVVKNAALTEQFKGRFTKYQSTEKGLSFGFIPLSDEEMIWFSQFDVEIAKKIQHSPNDLEGFIKELLIDFPPIVHDLINETNFTGSYLWQTRDFDPLPSFHKGNVVLIGDSAHLALPFTSAGTTNAMLDAEELVRCMDQHADLEKAFEQYYQKRIFNVTEHVNLGRNLKKSFLNPMLNHDEDAIPLIPQNNPPVVKGGIKPKIEIIYFTDPICSTCWSIQPELRKLKRDYGKHLSFRYVMTGLLPSWENYNRHGIRTPTDVIQHWREISEQSSMPIDDSIWINDPVQSSFPPSIAFKAAQLQDIDRAILFIRRLNEMVFFNNENIEKIEVIRKAAYEVGLDVVRLLKDLEKHARQRFFDDLAFAQYHQINELPTFIFKMQGIIYERINGAATYQQIKRVLLKIDPTIQKDGFEERPEDLFRSYPSLTKKEFSFLSDTNEEEAETILEELVSCGIARECKNIAGSIWESNVLPPMVYSLMEEHHPQF